MSLIIAIDGPSASGKSTVSRRVAQRLGFIHVDSGSLYRGVTWHFIENGVDAGNVEAVADALQKMRLEFFTRENSVRFSIEGRKPDEELRSRPVNEMVSTVAALPAVRAWVVSKLRKMPDLGNLVMEGRDIGTAVFPETKFKFYLDAAPEERARRRHLEMLNAGKKVDYDEILRSILKRDRIDTARASDPLKIAPDAVVIQSTDMTIDEVVDLIAGKIKY